MSIRSNIRKLYLLAVFESVIFYYAFDKIFMQLRGLSVSEIVFVEVILGLLVLTLEVPSGALSDRWSRKYVLALSSFFLALNTIIWAVSDNFWFFALGASMGAIHWVLRSGTNTSLMFDSLKQVGLEGEYEKYLGRRRAIGGATVIFAAMIGGLIADRFGIEAAFWLSLPSSFMAVVVALSLVEPTFHRSTGEVSYWKHIKTTGKFLRSKKKFIHVIALAAAIMSAQLVLDEYSQLYFAFAGIGIVGLGLLSSFSGLKEAVLNISSHKIGKLVDRGYLYGALLVVMSLSLLLSWVSVNWLGIVCLFVASGVFFVIDVNLMADFNRQIPSKVRATSESFVSLVSTVVHLPVVLGFAFISQVYSVATGFGVLGVLVAVYTISYWLVSLKTIREISK